VCSPLVADDRDLPLLEFDPDRDAVIEPGAWHPKGGVPERAVYCFFPEVVEEVGKRGRVAVGFRSEIGKHLVYEIEHQGVPLAVMHAGIGAPASVFLFEDLIARGCTTLVACGGAGALLDHPVGHPIVVSAAVRDEGTSFHYLPAAREIDADPAGVAVLRKVLEDRDLPYEVGKTWTTDAPYRETRAKVARRREEGCLTVEMEASALIAVARFRDIRFAQVIYAGDSLASEVYDHRGWDKHLSVRENLFWIAADAAAAWPPG
jgi:uridine phosphorylase